MSPSAIAVRPHLEVDATHATLPPAERLRLMADKLRATRNNELGIGYHEDKNGNASLVFANLEGNSVVTVRTPLSREMFESIMKPTLPLDETKLMLYELAKAFDQKTPIMFEGGTAIGKTFAVNLFAKLIYGEKAKIPDFYCNGQTDVSELLGKYVPAAVKPEDQARITTYLNTDAGKALKAEILHETGGKYEFKELYNRAAAALNIPIDKSSFEFQLGVLPKAMTAGHDAQGLLQYVSDGPGVMLHVQEVGMAAPSVVNALLQIRGEKGRLAESIQVWQDGGREVEAGPGFFVVFSTNPPGKGFQERFEVDKALARAIVWVNLPDKLSDESIRRAASKIFSFKDLPAQHGTIIDISSSPELGAVLGKVMANFHKAYVDMLDKGEPGRKQKVPVTLDSLWRVAELVQEVQVLSRDGTTVDMVETLRQAVRATYINCLQDKPPMLRASDMHSTHSTSIGAKVLEMFEQCLTNDATNSFDFRGEKVVPKVAIETLVREALNPVPSHSGDGLTQVAQTVDAYAVIDEVEASLRWFREHQPDKFAELLEKIKQNLSPELLGRLNDRMKTWTSVDGEPV
jgi:MoxR-like ATPase